MTAIETYAAPTGLEDAVRLTAPGNATLFAGGTDLMLQTRSGAKVFQPVLVNLRRIPELRGIDQTGESIRIGALSTVTEILESPLLAERAAVLVESADCFASGQLRNCATIGGNICNASPAGDLIIPLLVLDAEVELASWSGDRLKTRTAPLDGFFAGPGQTAAGSSEILTSIRFAAADKALVTGFRKFGTRPALDIAVVSVGFAGKRENGGFRNVRVAFGAVAPVPLRARQTEAVLEGEALSDDKIAEAARTAEGEIHPISDVRASAWYRKELIRTLTTRLLRDVRHP